VKKGLKTTLERISFGWTIRCSWAQRTGTNCFPLVSERHSSVEDFVCYFEIEHLATAKQEDLTRHHGQQGFTFPQHGHFAQLVVGSKDDAIIAYRWRLGNLSPGGTRSIGWPGASRRLPLSHFADMSLKLPTADSRFAEGSFRSADTEPDSKRRIPADFRQSAAEQKRVLLRTVFRSGRFFQSRIFARPAS
jgi:hypothetical protein